MKIEKVVNGNCSNSNGFRQILLDRFLNPRPVVYGIYTGDESEKCSVQVSPETSDILLKIQWGSLAPAGIGTVTEYPRPDKPNLASPEKSADILKRAFKEHDWLKDWLNPQAHVSSFIPRGIIPDSEYLSVKNKVSRVTAFCMKYQIPVIDDEDGLIRSPKSGINLEEKQLDFNLSEYIPETTRVYGEYHDIDQQELWFSVGRLGTSKLLETDPSIHQKTNDGEDETVMLDGKTLKEAGLPIAWTKLIRIQCGAYIKNSESYGYKIDIWTH